MTGNAWFILTYKLKRVKIAMKKLNVADGNLHNEVIATRVALLSFQASLNALSAVDHFNEEWSLKEKFESFLKKEEIFLRQKAKMHWLKHSDGNNKFFFNSYKGR